MSTRDVSAGGMRLLSERALGKGDHLELEILLPDGSWLPVTTKVAWSVKLDVERYEFWRAGVQSTLTLADPAGSDNTDPWHTVTDSFTWR